jgi:hypothetical protein
MRPLGEIMCEHNVLGFGYNEKSLLTEAFRRTEL